MVERDHRKYLRVNECGHRELAMLGVRAEDKCLATRTRRDWWPVITVFSQVRLLEVAG